MEKAAPATKTKWASRGKRGVHATLIEMAASHSSHAECWLRFMSMAERQEAAGRGFHPFFQGEGVCPRWSGFGDPPPLHDTVPGSIWWNFAENDKENEPSSDRNRCFG